MHGDARTPQGPQTRPQQGPSAAHEPLTQTDSAWRQHERARELRHEHTGRHRTVALQRPDKQLRDGRHTSKAAAGRLRPLTYILRHPTCGDSICLSTTICAREHIVSVRNRCTDNVHAVERSSGSACPCGVVFRATLRRPATAKSSRRFRR